MNAVYKKMKMLATVLGSRRHESEEGVQRGCCDMISHSHKVHLSLTDEQEQKVAGLRDHMLVSVLRFLSSQDCVGVGLVRFLLPRSNCMASTWDK